MTPPSGRPRSPRWSTPTRRTPISASVPRCGRRMAGDHRLQHRELGVRAGDLRGNPCGGFCCLTRAHRNSTRWPLRRKTVEPTPPCGTCRQVLNEFAPNITISSYTRDGTGSDLVSGRAASPCLRASPITWKNVVKLLSYRYCCDRRRAVGVVPRQCVLRGEAR